jgi:N-acyl-D-amino-acid deacylase
VLLDPARVRERATYADPRRLSEGTEYVWVNGTLMLERGTLRDERPGRVLRGSSR